MDIVKHRRKAPAMPIVTNDPTRSQEKTRYMTWTMCKSNRGNDAGLGIELVFDTFGVIILGGQEFLDTKKRSV